MQIQIDEYAHLNSWIHRWDPRYKLVAIACLIFAFACIESLWLLPLIVAITVGLYVTSRLPLRFLCRRLRYPGLFLLGIVVLLPWQAGETVLWQVGSLSLRQEGLVAVLLIACRFLCILTAGLVLLGTMSFLTTIKAMRALGLPVVLSDMTLLTYRYLFEVADSLKTMQRAMRLRGYGAGYRQSSSHPRSHGHSHSHGHRRWAVPSLQDVNRLASLTGTLFIRSYEQSERVYKAMRLRGYGSGYRPQLAAMLAPAPGDLPPWLSRLAAAVTVTIAMALVGLEVAL
ncbi:MAG: cobalt ECF transporter T component CbiQ [Cyanobacteria bacterium P01_A01_bin.135]